MQFCFLNLVLLFPVPVAIPFLQPTICEKSERALTLSVRERNISFVIIVLSILFSPFLISYYSYVSRSWQKADNDVLSINRLSCFQCVLATSVSA